MLNLLLLRSRMLRGNNIINLYFVWERKKLIKKRKRPIHGFQTRKNKYVLDNRNIKHKEIKKESITCLE